MSTLWQGLGAFIYSGVNLRQDVLEAFAQAGGSWVVPVIYNDDAAGPWNLANVDALRERCAPLGISSVGCWFNGAGGDPAADAANVISLTKQHGLNPVVLDLEFKYQGAGAPLMPQLVAAVRDGLPTADVAVTTNGLNDAMIWNGRTLTPPRSFYQLGVRVLPQWYNSPLYAGSEWADPVANMRWLRENAGTDGNFRDPAAKKVSYRGVPLSYVHAAVEATGMENAVLEPELENVAAARVYGYTWGLVYYTLEGDRMADMPLLAAQRGKLFR